MSSEVIKIFKGVFLICENLCNLWTNDFLNVSAPTHIPPFMRKIILNLHLYGALIAGIFLIILGVTGAIIAFEDDLDRLFNARLYKVELQPTALSITAIVAALEKAYPAKHISLLRLPAHPSDAYITQLGSKQIFINGYTGAIIGERTTPTLLNQIHQLHMRLLAGNTGAEITKWTAVLSVFLILSGLYLWFPLKMARIKLAAPRRKFSYQIHNVAGIYFALFLFVLSLTGIVLGFDEIITPWFYKVTHTSPPPRNFPSIVQPGGNPITADDALNLARATLPGATPSYIVIPQKPAVSFMVSLRFPEDLTGGRSWVNIDQFSGKVLFVENSRTPTAGAGIINLNRAIHTGDIYGYPTKILMSLSSLMLAIQVITGYCMWWKKLCSRSPAQSSRE